MQSQRKDMVESQIMAEGVRSPDVLRAMENVLRHEFVPAMYQDRAYENGPLPIGHGQTISQPFMVALMTELAHVDETSKVFEVGTGSGYQAAVLAEIVAQVFTVEYIEELGQEAAERLKRLGYDNVHVRTGDGYAGWPEEAPFDAILVTAAISHIPQPLIDQLKPGGRMVIPVGEGKFSQVLMAIEKNGDGTLEKKQVVPVRFVPFLGPNASE